jgi:hypothetical protein
MIKRLIIYIFLALGIMITGTGVWLLFNPSGTTSTGTGDTAAINSFQEDFGFRGKQVSSEEASNMVGAKVPEPTYLPEGYAIQEVYISVDNDIVILLISDVPIDKMIREPPDEPKDYPINMVKCKMVMYVSFEHDLSIVGGDRKPIPMAMKFSDDEHTEGRDIFWGADFGDKTASLHLVAGDKNIASWEELTKIAESVSTESDISRATGISIEPTSGAYLTQGIVIENASVFIDILNRNAMNGWSTDIYYAGDPCYVVKGTMKNDTDTDWQVCFHAEGYDSSGNQLSQTLNVETGPLAGLIAFDISAHTTRNFTIHMNWAENVSRIVISADTYDTKTPLP